MPDDQYTEGEGVGVGVAISSDIFKNEYNLQSPINFLKDKATKHNLCCMTQNPLKKIL